MGFAHKITQESFTESTYFHSSEIRDGNRAYQLGANSFFVKDLESESPVDFAAVLSAIGLDLQPAISAKEVRHRFGKPPRWKRKDGGYVIFDTDAEFRYEVSCAYTDDNKLCQVRVRRLDIEIPDDD